MKKYLIAFLLLLGLSPCALYAFEKTDICFQFDPVIKNEAKLVASKYLEDETGLDESGKAKLKKAKKHFFDTLSKSLKEVGVPRLTCFEVAKVCYFAGWDFVDDKCVGFVGDLQKLHKKVVKKYVNEKTPVSEITTVKDGQQEITKYSSHLKIRDCSRIVDEAENEIDLCSIDDPIAVDNIVSAFNNCDPNEAWKYQEKCLKKHGYSFDGEKISKKDTDDNPCEKMDLEEDGFKRMELKRACCKKMCGNGACSIDNGLVSCSAKIESENKRDNEQYDRCADWSKSKVEFEVQTLEQGNKYDPTMDFMRYQKLKNYKECFEQYGYYFDDKNMKIRKKK